MLGCLDGNGLKPLQPGGAAERQPAAADSAEKLGLVSNTNLAHLDSGLESRSQVLYERPEIHATVGRIVKDYLAPIEKVLDPREFHDQAVLFHQLAADLPGLFLFLPLLLEERDIFRTGPPQNLTPTRKVIRNLFSQKHVNDSPQLHSPVTLDDTNLVPAERQVLSQIPIYTTTVVYADLSELKPEHFFL